VTRGEASDTGVDGQSDGVSDAVQAASSFNSGIKTFGGTATNGNDVLGLRSCWEDDVGMDRWR
jgi:hypothetical protein